MFTITEAFDSLMTEVITVTRITASNQIIDFEVVESNISDITSSTASVQQSNPKDLSFLPSGYNISEYFTVYTTYPLRMASSVGGGTAADIVTYNSVEYRVISVSNRQSGGYTKAIIFAGNQ